MQTNKIFKGQCTQLGVVTDESGVMRCKGRLANSTLPDNTKYTILIPSGHHLSKLLIEDAHKRVMHNGVRETLNEIRSTFWLIRGRQTVRKILHSCVTCKRHEGSPYKCQQASDMPEFRFRERKPFATTGVDFAGPLFTRATKGSQQTSKVYICLFTCGSTRATHLELAPNLSTPAFIRCLRRFVARRGTPELIVSDNAKTFKAAAKELTKTYEDPATTTYLVNQKIQWKFNLEKAPWWGGIF